MNHADHRKHQTDILTQVLAILEKDDGVLGIVATGSYTRGEIDAFSDLDVGCYLRDEDRSARQSLYDQISEIDPLLCRLWIYDVHALYLFENGVRLDLDFYRPSAMPTTSYLQGNIAILHDPNDTLAHSLVITDSLRPAEHPKWFQPGDTALIDWFFWMFRQIVCWAKRGAQGGERAFTKLSYAVDSLAEVRTRLVEMRLWTLGFQDYLGRADPECTQRLAQTYPHLVADEIIDCTKLLLDEYERVCPAYCQKAGAIYPDHKVNVIRGLIADFEQLP